MQQLLSGRVRGEDDADIQLAPPAIHAPEREQLLPSAQQRLLEPRLLIFGHLVITGQ